MFERVIAQTIQKVTTDILQERPLIALTEILENERIPERLKPFFETEVSWWLYNETLARAANKRFDYEHPELASLLTYLEQVQFRHARFEREDFLTVLDSAVKLTYNYLCRPQTTLKWYIFRGQPVKPLREVMLRFGAFHDYPYFRRVFIDWVERKQSERPTFDAISSTEFERVIRRIDDQILLNCTVEDLLAMIQPLFEFVGEGPEQQVPIDALVIFFDDKNIKKLVDFLERGREAGRTMVGREDFVSLIDELLSVSEDEPEADFSNVYQNDELDDVVRQHLHANGSVTNPVGSDAEPQDLTPTAPYAPAQAAEPSNTTHINLNTDADQAQPSATLVEVSLSADDIDDDDAVDADHDDMDGEEVAEIPEAESQSDASAMLTSWISSEDHQAFMDAFGDAPTGLDVVESSADNGNGNASNVDDATAKANDDVDKKDAANPDDETSHRSVLDSLAMRQATTDILEKPPGTMVDVRRFIDPVLERKIIKRIFGRSRTEYDAALDQLNLADNWKAASHILDELFVRFEVDPYSRTAIRFTDSVYGRYLGPRM